MQKQTARPAIAPGYRLRLRRAAAAALALVLAACGSDGPVPTPDHAPDPPAPTGHDAPVAPATEDPNGAGGEPPADAGLPPVRELPVTVEGQTELRTATLFESPQGYAIYVLPQLAMTPEEPCCDLAHARVDGEFFMRIERIDPGQDPATLRGNIELALSQVGEPEAVPPEHIATPQFRDAELFMRARGDGVSLTMLVARIDGGRYRVTLHLPHREPAEGINPSLWAMLASLRTTGPHQRP